MKAYFYISYFIFEEMEKHKGELLEKSARDNIGFDQF